MNKPTATIGRSTPVSLPVNFRVRRHDTGIVLVVREGPAAQCKAQRHGRRQPNQRHGSCVPRRYDSMIHASLLFAIREPRRIRSYATAASVDGRDELEGSLA